ncbi:MAG: hypothetical protein ACLFTJ_05660 [Halothece sp.]
MRQKTYLSLLSLPLATYWDFAGVDGLAFARDLIGETADRLSVFQSQNITIAGETCSLLRLCEKNFRLGASQTATEKIESHLRSAQNQWCVWVNRCENLGTLALPDASGMSFLQENATAKPPHRLQGLGRDRAVPARLNDIPILIWRRRQWVELQVALSQKNDLETVISNQICYSNL